MRNYQPTRGLSRPSYEIAPLLESIRGLKRIDPKDREEQQGRDPVDPWRPMGRPFSRRRSSLPPSSRVIPTHPRPFLTRLSAAYTARFGPGSPVGYSKQITTRGGSILDPAFVQTGQRSACRGTPVRSLCRLTCWNYPN